jgi:hypothetical protein
LLSFSSFDSSSDPVAPDPDPVAPDPDPDFVSLVLPAPSEIKEKYFVLNYS